MGALYSTSLYLTFILSSFSSIDSAAIYGKGVDEIKRDALQIVYPHFGEGQEGSIDGGLMILP